MVDVLFRSSGSDLVLSAYSARITIIHVESVADTANKQRARERGYFINHSDR